MTELKFWALNLKLEHGLKSDPNTWLKKALTQSLCILEKAQILSVKSVFQDTRNDRLLIFGKPGILRGTGPVGCRNGRVWR